MAAFLALPTNQKDRKSEEPAPIAIAIVMKSLISIPADVDRVG
jgi:hypothetical protein